MIIYSPINGEVLTSAVKFHVRTCFVMTQLGSPLPEELQIIREGLHLELVRHNFREIDASSLVTGKDFLDKIWKIIVGVPIGIAILTKDIPERTIANIYYELGIMDSLGKETLIVKTKGYEIPSDFKRTEYLNYGDDFKYSFEKFCDNLKVREEHFWLMAELMQSDPVLSIDYIRRAYLINPIKKYMTEAERVFSLNQDKIDSQSKIHIKSFLKIQ